VRNARVAIEAFERAAVHEARRRGFDGVICGHIHQPELRVIDDTLYCNDGDWVESCTALVEHRDGRLGRPPPAAQMRAQRGRRRTLSAVAAAATIRAARAPRPGAALIPPDA
jgi:hypothetical protein